MADDPKHRPPLAMRLQFATAEIANGPPPQRLAGNIDFPANAPAQPFFLFPSRCATQLFNRADKLMSGNTSEIVITVQKLHVGIADPDQPYAHQRPTPP